VEVRDLTLHKKITYEYDPNGNRTKETVASLPGDPVPQTPLVIRYAYDLMNRLVEVTDPTGGKTRLSYDQSGRRTSLTYGNGIVGSYGYDGAGRLISIVYVNPRGEVVEAFIYTLDRAGNRLSKQFADGRRETYGYDDANRLTEATYRDGKRQIYNLDRVGNRRSLDEYEADGTRKYESYTQNAFNQILTRKITRYGSPTVTTDEVYGWDPQGAMTSVAATTGGVTETTTYGYNSNERLSRITFPASHATADSVFGYDVDGLRVYKVEGESVTRQLLDGPEVLAEYADTGARTAVHVRSPQRIDELFVSYVDDGSGALEPVYPLTDALGSIYAFAGGSGRVEARRSYDVYGAPFNSGDAVVSSPHSLSYGFSGRDHSLGGFTYHRARFLEQGLGIWSRPDPLGMLDDGNLFLYGKSNPLSNIDPTGLFATIGLARAVGIVASEIWIEVGLRYIYEALIAKLSGDGIWEFLFDYGAVFLVSGIVMSLIFMAGRAGCPGRRGIPMPRGFADFGMKLRRSPLFGTRGVMNGNRYLRIGVGRYGGRNTIRLGGKFIEHIERVVPGARLFIKDKHIYLIDFGPM